MTDAIRALQEDRDVARALFEAVEAELKALDDAIGKTPMQRIKDALQKRREVLAADVEKARIAWEAMEIALRAAREAAPIANPFDSAPETSSEAPISEEEEPRTEQNVSPFAAPAPAEDSNPDTVDNLNPKTHDSQDSQRLVVMARSIEGDAVGASTWLLPGPTLSSVTSGSDEILKVVKVMKDATGAVQVRDLVGRTGMSAEKVLLTVTRMVKLKLLEVT